MPDKQSFFGFIRQSVLEAGTINCGVLRRSILGLLLFLLLNGMKVWVFFGKNIERKHLCRHDKNYYYFCKSNISVINLIVDSRNMTEVSKKYEFVKK